MEERNSKVIAIVALCIGVVGLSLGFAAFTSQLTIKSGATVTVNQDTQFESVFGYDVNPTAGEVAAKYDNAWTGITHDFTATGDSATYTATIVNDSQLTAYLNNTPTATVTSCTAAEGTTETLRTAACGQIGLTVNAPASVPAGDSAQVSVTITGPTTAVDGNLTVVFSDVTLDYTTAAPANQG